MKFVLEFKIMMDDYKRMLQKARKDLEAALRQKAELDARVVTLKQAVAALSALAGESSQDDSEIFDPTVAELQGITNGIRRVLSKSSVPMSAPEIRDALLERPEYGPIVMGYANPLSVLHNTLVRLIRQGEVVQTSSGFSLKDKS